MGKSLRWNLLGTIALLLMGAAVAVLGYSLATTSGTSGKLPGGSAWGGVPVGGLTVEEAAARVEMVFSTPLELRYLNETIQVAPPQLGFTPNIAAMIAEARRSGPGSLLWDRLWSRSGASSTLALQYEIDGETLRAYLTNEIVARYDQIAQPALPIPGSTNFSAGTAGRRLDVIQSVQRISQALADPVNRTVELVVAGETIPAARLQNLEIFLKQTIAASGFTGIAEVYMQYPKTGELLHFASRGGMDIPVDIAFSAASTMKIPIMVSALRRTGEPIPDEVQQWIERMIVLSENPPADTLMENVIGSTVAPLEVTADMQDRLGLKNTFLAGYFYFGAPLLQLFQTPANSRTDVNLDPDVYNQTTTSDMGALLAAIYQCAQGEPTLLTDVFAGEVTPSKCGYMLDVLARNEIGVLSEAGVPDGTRVAHKHGWTEEADGFLHTISDAGIVFSPGSDFVFVVFLYDANQLLFDPADELIAQLVQIMYNYYNPLAQEPWLGGPVVFP
ncbi:MAG: serine hydrolase [Bellilinea sp.]